tara:strand:+ start:8535 stop:8756 length:222 start_codon:yes stop_codon:yes gene_type:complete
MVRAAFRNMKPFNRLVGQPGNFFLDAKLLALHRGNFEIAGPRTFLCPLNGIRKVLVLSAKFLDMGSNRHCVLL